MSQKDFSNWLVVSDIDGTLNNKARKLPRRNYDAYSTARVFMTFNRRR